MSFQTRTGMDGEIYDRVRGDYLEYIGNGTEP